MSPSPSESIACVLSSILPQLQGNFPTCRVLAGGTSIMGDQAVRYALQQTHLSPIAQIIFVRICKHVLDKDAVWIWRKKRSVIVIECNTSEATLKRYFLELEGKDQEGKPVKGAKPVLFRGLRAGRSSEYIILGPNQTATAAYIAACHPAQVEPTNPAQTEPTRPGSNRAESGRGSAQVEPHPAQIEPTNKDIEPSLGILSSVHSSNPKQDREHLQEIWKSALTKIRTQVDSQTCFTWYDPARPVSLRDGVLTIAVPSVFFVDTLKALELKEHTILRSVLAAGLVVREITFVARPKLAAVAARASPR